MYVFYQIHNFTYLTPKSQANAPHVALIQDKNVKSKNSMLFIKSGYQYIISNSVSREYITNSQCF